MIPNIRCSKKENNGDCKEISGCWGSGGRKDEEVEDVILRVWKHSGGYCNGGHVTIYHNRFIIQDQK